MGWTLSSGTLSAKAYLYDSTGERADNFYTNGTASISGAGASASYTVSDNSAVSGSASISPSQFPSAPKNGDTCTFTFIVRSSATGVYTKEYHGETQTKYIKYEYTESSGGDSGDNESGTTTDKCYCGKELVDGKCPDPNCVFREEEDEGGTYYYKWDTSASGLEIIDNYNNTFTIKAKTNYTATYNYPIDSEYDYLRYGFTKGDGASITAAKTNYPYTCTNITNTEDASGIGWTSGSGYLSGQPVENAEVTVYAKGWWEPYLSTNGNYYGHVSTTSKSIKHYVAPSAASNLRISYTKNKFTLKEPWELSWNAANESNSNSPVKGYIVRLERKRGDDDFADMGGSSSITQTTFTYGQALQHNADIKAGDTVRFSVLAYTQFGENNQGSELYDEATRVYSGEYVIENNGILHVKTADGWKEGQVFVKTSTGWKESEGIYVKTTEGWKESQ